MLKSKASRSAVTQPKEESNAKFRSPIESKTLRREHDLLLKEVGWFIATGEAMYPYLFDGDEIQCNDKQPKNGKLVTAKLKDGRTFIARIAKRSDKVTLRFENPSFPALTFNRNEFAYIATVDTILRDVSREGGAR